MAESLGYHWDGERMCYDCEGYDDDEFEDADEEEA